MPYNLGKLLQYRCFKCKHLLFKYRVGDEKIQRTDSSARFIKRIDGKFDVICSKCNTRQEIAEGGTREIELKEK